MKFLILALAVIVGASGCGDKDKSPPDDDKIEVQAKKGSEGICGVQVEHGCLEQILRAQSPLVCQSPEDVFNLVRAHCQ